MKGEVYFTLSDAGVAIVGVDLPPSGGVGRPWRYQVLHRPTNLKFSPKFIRLIILSKGVRSSPSSSSSYSFV